MLALTWPDFDLIAGALTISKSLEQTKAGLRLKETKGRNIGRVKLPQDAIDALQRVNAAQMRHGHCADPTIALILTWCFAIRTETTSGQTR
jgi:hypothetical protein